MLNFGGLQVENLTSGIARNRGGGMVAQRDGDKGTARTFCKSLQNSDIQSFSSLNSHLPLLKHISLTSEIYMFRVMKDRVSGCKRPCFGR